jgi:integrase
MNKVTGQGYGRYTPPKQEKRHPLTRRDTRKLYQAACEYPDRETELVGRVLLDYGLRVGELAHTCEAWIGTEYNQEGGELWRISIPRIEYCYGGKGGSAGHHNADGANLHKTDESCSYCVDRNWEAKINGNTESATGWVTEEEGKKYDWAPKSRRSATKVWQFPNIEESAETARLLKEFLSAQKHRQWPHGQNAIRNRLNKLVEAADLNLPDRVHNRIVPHALRHTYGCRLVEASIGEGAAMKQMRHQNADIFHWYSDVRDARVISAMANAVSESDSLLHE